MKAHAIFFAKVLAAVAVINAVPQLSGLATGGNKFFKS